MKYLILAIIACIALSIGLSYFIETDGKLSTINDYDFNERWR